MKVYMLKRILFSIFSLAVVVMIVMLLVYSLIDRKVIFQTDDIWNKKFLNDRTAYEYSQYEKFGYMTTTNYGAYLKDIYKDVEDYENDARYKEDKNAVKKKFTFLESDGISAFIDKYGYLQMDKFDSFLFNYYTEKKTKRVNEINKRIKEIENTKEPASEDEKRRLGNELAALKAELPVLQKQLDERNYDSDSQYVKDHELIKEVDVFLENESVRGFVEKYTAQGYKISYLEPVKYSNGKDKPGGSGQLYAIKERFVLWRLWDYVKGLITVETTNDVNDPNLTDRYIRFENDPNGWFAVVGSGTQHKYLLYFDDRFPFIHQNFIHLNLGVSHTRYRGEEITNVITTPQGSMKNKNIIAANGEIINTSINVHSVKYSQTAEVGEELKNMFADNYTSYQYNFDGLSRIENSFVCGIISTILAYLLGLPLGILMARQKEKFIDHLGNVYIIFIMAVPSLAYIFMFAVIGTTVFKLPYSFANSTRTIFGTQTKLLGYFLPIISLTLPSIGGLMKWMRRYMIDQMNSDYVKFARSQGLSEGEIYRTHISRNAMIYIVHGIPGAILGSLTGAIITERVYGLPGVGNLLTEAINRHDNAIIVACTVFYTTLSIISLILGDLLLAKYDPRISLSSSKGGGR